jgi:hypothetical protein
MRKDSPVEPVNDNSKANRVGDWDVARSGFTIARGEQLGPPESLLVPERALRSGERVAGTTGRCGLGVGKGEIEMGMWLRGEEGSKQGRLGEEEILV